MEGKKTKGFWTDIENCKKEAFAVMKAEGWTEVPMSDEIRRAGITSRGMQMLGNRDGIAKLLGLPLRKKQSGRPKHANVPAPEKWDGKPSRAFEIEAEAREKGLHYADIQKAKTLAMVGGVKI